MKARWTMELVSMNTIRVYSRDDKGEIICKKFFSFNKAIEYIKKLNSEIKK